MSNRPRSHFRLIGREQEQEAARLLASHDDYVSPFFYDPPEPNDENAVVMRMDMAMQQLQESMFQEKKDESDPNITCPVCSTLHKPMDEHEDGDGEGDRRAVPAQEHKCSHGATMVFFELDRCPVCLEEKIQPAIALPCGHGICQGDFKQIGGRIGSSKHKCDVPDESDCGQPSGCPCPHCTRQRRMQEYLQYMARRAQEDYQNIDDNHDETDFSPYDDSQPMEDTTWTLSASQAPPVLSWSETIASMTLGLTPSPVTESNNQAAGPIFDFSLLTPELEPSLELTAMDATSSTLVAANIPVTNMAGNHDCAETPHLHNATIRALQAPPVIPWSETMSFMTLGISPSPAPELSTTTAAPLFDFSLLGSTLESSFAFVNASSSTEAVTNLPVTRA